MSVGMNIPRPRPLYWGVADP